VPGPLGHEPEALLLLAGWLAGWLVGCLPAAAVGGSG